jgi:hypothetical protein
MGRVFSTNMEIRNVYKNLIKNIQQKRREDSKDVTDV